MATTAFPVKQTSDGVGCSDTTLRKILASIFSNKGIVSGLTVSGSSSGMYYTVASGVSICSKGTSDGNTIAYFAGGNTDSVSTNTSSNSRIDSVWITSHDVTQGDADNLVTIGVTEGTASASPSAPTIPTYATLLSNMVVPAGATTTETASAANQLDYAIPYGTSLGVVFDQTDTTNRVTCGGTRTVISGSFYLPTDRNIQINHTFTGCNASGDFQNGSSVYCHVYIDGAVVHEHEQKTWPGIAASYFFQETRAISAGNHTVSLVYVAQADNYIEYYSKGGWAGQRLQLVDVGVVK